MHNSSGLTVLSEQALDQRLFTVQVRTSALPGPANVRILLPTSYEPGRRYPVLYLLHGTSGGAADWTTQGNAETVTEGLPVIVVMPDIALNDDGGGWCTNWPDGLYSWETFHISQLIPWIDANLPTVPTRAQRAIAGLSQGGFCSMSYAARHPDLFANTFAFSGAPDIAYSVDAVAVSTTLINLIEVAFDNVPANSMFGDRVTNEINWAAHDPATLAPNLQGMNLYQFHGDGTPGPLDTPEFVASESGVTAVAIETALLPLNVDFHQRLGTLGIANFYDFYGPGTHAWPYWNRDLAQSIPMLMSSFSNPVPEPAAISYTSGDNAYAVYGWSVTMNRTAREFSTLANASCSGFTLSGSGSGSVTTPPCFVPGSAYKVTLFGSQTGETSVTTKANSSGRLVFTVPLGPANPYQEYTAQAATAGTLVYSTEVTIGRTK